MGDGNCDDAIHRLYQFIDGELTPDRRAAIQQHLDACPPCFEAFDFEAELRIVISQRCRDQVPGHLVQRISDAIRQESAGGGMPTV